MGFRPTTASTTRITATRLSRTVGPQKRCCLRCRPLILLWTIVLHPSTLLRWRRIFLILGECAAVLHAITCGAVLPQDSSSGGRREAARLTRCTKQTARHGSPTAPPSQGLGYRIAAEPTAYWIVQHRTAIDTRMRPCSREQPVHRDSGGGGGGVCVCRHSMRHDSAEMQPDRNHRFQYTIWTLPRAVLVGSSTFPEKSGWKARVGGGGGVWGLTNELIILAAADHVEHQVVAGHEHSRACPGRPSPRSALGLGARRPSHRDAGLLRLRMPGARTVKDQILALRCFVLVICFQAVAKPDDSNGLQNNTGR